jgi:hypothetical protein
MQAYLDLQAIFASPAQNDMRSILKILAELAKVLLLSMPQSS